MTLVNDDAEVAVLGSILLEGTLFKKVTVTENQFDSNPHKLIFGAMKQVADAGQAIDLVTVTTNLGDAIREVGGTTYLLSLAESVPSTESFAHYERLLYEAYRNRKSRELAIRYSENPCEEKLDKLIGYLQVCREMGPGTTETENATSLEEIAHMVLTGECASAGLPTPYTDLDNLTGGLQPGELIIVAARPSVGKTAFALNLAAGHCRNHGMSSFFSFEMGKKQLLQRLISAEGNIHNQKWRNMAFNEKDYSAVAFAVGEVSNWKLAIHEKQRTISDIRAVLRKTIHDHPEEKHLVCIDYLQLITPLNKQQRRDLEIGEITRELKLLAIELNIPIVLLSQLSRSVEQRHDKRPFMSDLRESGNIEQDADVIAFLYRDDYYDHASDKKNIVEITLAKQRNGPTGTVELVFLKEYGSFQNYYKDARRERHEEVKGVRS
ncbi:replicative DNA helicase [Aquibacillus koreensis]|uniref:Replicative DNA helicase n=1 Tax=Aquibacillus koreensis TaxID=279446 RepID=A0A9X4AHD6_9BACI|nr:replicative DNA helicase [Aquibacillus koreensis]MCT2534785.1 replicative DNA helicase [Aquibacillus koreensis]MDC3419604.1 replicative DNA helicase [Aquibacillus koreensis]